MAAPLPPLIQLNNPRLLVRDFARSWAFYRETLGLGAAFGDGTPPYGEVGDAEHFVGIFSRSAFDEVIGPERAGTTDAERFLLVFEVADVDAEHARLTRLRVPLLTSPTDRPLWGLRTVHLRDPDGNVVELYTRLKRPTADPVG